MKAVLVDPSLYTGPYDAGLDAGLSSAGIAVRWLTRPARLGERCELPPERTEAFFYRRSDQAEWLPASARVLVKGCAHLLGVAKMLWTIRRERPDVVHYQWIVVPVIDIAAMSVIRRWCALVLTMHDTVAYNGEKMSSLQTIGQALPARLAHRVIVHTASARERLLESGVAEERVKVIAHGPLRLPVTATAPANRDPRWTLVLFGEIKPYKGLDVLIEAVAAIPRRSREALRIIVAGRPRMNLAPLVARIDGLGLGRQFEVRPRRLGEDEMATLFAEADAFVLPYREVDASGVYYLVKPLGKWLIASRVGIFAEDLQPGVQGELVPPGDPLALARALESAVRHRPRPQPTPFDRSWADIGRATRALYEQAAAEFESGRALGQRRDAWQR